MREFIKEVCPFYLSYGMTKDWTGRDWGNPVLVFLAPILGTLLILDIVLLPVSVPVWSFRLSVLRLSKFFNNPVSGEYYLKKRKAYSKITSDEVRYRFEERQVSMGYKGSFNRSTRGPYEDDNLQTRWEEFANGFRSGEDSI